MQEIISRDDPSGIRLSTDTTDFDATAFTAMESQDQMIFMASTLVSIYNTVNTLT